MLDCSICVTTCNEEKTIGLLLGAILKQKLSRVTIKEIFVVASGCTDHTVEVVKTFCSKDPRIHLIQQDKREGKAAAINLFLSSCNYDICILESGDTIPLENTIEQIVVPFENQEIGMTGAHPVPVNSDQTLIGYLACFNWRLTHELALRKPRLGEMIAFRRIFSRIPADTAVDEAYIESIICKNGYRLKYCPNAIVRNKGAETVSEYLRQSRRWFAGHLHLKKITGYRVSSFNLITIAYLVFLDILHRPKLKNALFTFGACFIELLGRLLGFIDFYILKRNPYIWKIAESTKKL